MRFFALTVISFVALVGCSADAKPTVSLKAGISQSFSPGLSGGDIIYHVDLQLKNTGTRPVEFSLLEGAFVDGDGQAQRILSKKLTSVGPGETIKTTFEGDHAHLPVSFRLSIQDKTGLDVVGPFNGRVLSEGVAPVYLQFKTPDGSVAASINDD